MSRKPVRPVKTPPGKASASDEQAQTARVHLEKGRFRDAAACYKALLKTERRAEWISGLASAYAGRAMDLAAKGMLQEAIGLWRSRAELCGTSLWEGQYAAWLASEGRVADVLDHLSALRATAGAAADAQPAGELALLEAQLAPALLQANEATLARLPADSLLRLHQPRALATLKAYGGKDMAALDEALAGIPFRSPYRDLRSLLKAMVLWETDQDGARAALDRLAPDGPFEPLAAPLRTLLLNGMERIKRWASLNSSQQAMALDLLGCPPAFSPLLRSLAAAEANLAPAALFDLVQKHARELPDPLATRLWQWLAPWAKRRGCDNPRMFGSPTPAAQERATALAVEMTGDWDHAESHWSGAADLMGASTDPRDRLRAALILRHMALSSAHLSSDDVLDLDGQEMLTQSLRFDAEVCDVHVRLVRFWRLHGNLKRSREQLDAGLKRFPDDVALLTEAVETAVAAGAFKKAAATAQRLLALDPLNRKVRVLLGNAHLSHAVKQIAARKPEAARQEITQATSWLGSVADQGRMQLLQAWTEPAGSTERLRLAQLAAATWGGGLAAGWRLLREAQGAFGRLGLTASQVLLSEANIDAQRVLTAADLLALVQVLAQDEPLVRKGLDPLLPWRRAIASMASTAVFDAETTVRVCEALSRQQEHDLLEKFANAARKRWPEQPIFVYHAAAARFGKSKFIDGKRDFDDLDAAAARARQNNDMKLAMRIDALFQDDEPLSEFGDSDFQDNPVWSGPPKLPFDPAELSVEEVRALFDEAIKVGGAKRFLDQAREDLGDDRYLQVERESAGNKRVFLNRIIDLAVGEFAASLGLPQRSVPAKINKPKASAPGQGSLFNE